MPRLQPTPVQHAFPQLRRLHFFSAYNQRLITDYLAHLRARHYASSTQEGALGALKCFAVLMPKARRAILYQDLTQTTPADIDAWIEAGKVSMIKSATSMKRLTFPLCCFDGDSSRTIPLTVGVRPHPL